MSAGCSPLVLGGAVITAYIALVITGNVKVWDEKPTIGTYPVGWDAGSLYGGQPRPSEASTHLAVKGIKNLGNTCFLNAVLQSLGSFPVFREYLEDLKALSGQPRGTSHAYQGDSPFTFELLNLMNHLKPRVPVTPSLAPVDATKIRRLLGNEVGAFGKGNQQQDAQELFQMVMRLLGEEAALCLQRNKTLQGASETGGAEGFKSLLSLTPTHGSRTGKTKVLPENPLLGSLMHVRHCRGCQRKSSRQARFVDLSLTLPEARNPKFAKPVKLEKILEDFIQEQLVEDVECDTCGVRSSMDANFAEANEREGEDEENEEEDGEEEVAMPPKRVPADMRMLLATLPKTLCLHFPRRHQNSSGSEMKLEQRVVFPPHLNVAPFCYTGGFHTSDIGVQTAFQMNTIASSLSQLPLGKTSPGAAVTSRALTKALHSPQTHPVLKQILVGGSDEGANGVGGRKELNGLPNGGARTGGSSVSGSVEGQESIDGSLPGNEGCMDYDLRAVIVHRGGADSGHYTAFRKLESNQKGEAKSPERLARVSKASEEEEEWVYISDEDVQRGVSESTVLKSQAYMLFYQQRISEVFSQGVS